MLVGLTIAAAGAAVPAQVTPFEPAKPVPAKSLRQAAEAWLTSDQTSRETLEQTVELLLQDVDQGLAWLSAQLPAADRSPAEPRSKGVHGLATHFVLEFLRKQHALEVVYAGQYAPLQQLQPFAGNLLFDLLLATPEWYPSTHRVRLVPALRDVQPTLPDAARVEAVIAIVENAKLEPQELRRALACMLWQWGRREFSQPFLSELQQASAEGDVEDRVQAMLDLAELQYQLRDYKTSAATHRALLAMAMAAKIQVKPVTHYSCACVHALIGDVEHGLAALQRCAALQASPTLDKSLRLKRTLFETDPEIAILRQDPRFPAILELAFASTTIERDAGKR